MLHCLLLYFQLVNHHRRKALTWISIYRLKGCIEPFVYRAGARFKSHLNEVSLGVHRRGKLLTTDLKVIRFSSMRGNVCDKDSGTICCRSSTVIVFTRYQGKVQKGQFDDFPIGYRDIPDTILVWTIVVGKIGAGNVTTRGIDGFSKWYAGWKREDFSNFFTGDETVPMKEGLNGVMAYIMRGPHWQPSRQFALLRGSRWGDGFYG